MGPENQRPGATLQTDPTTLPGGTEVRVLVHPTPGRTCVRGPFGPSTNEASRPIRHRTQGAAALCPHRVQTAHGPSCDRSPTRSSLAEP